ncbi:hypothetical protein LTR49_027838 [Elasticomyces elasticus]|nr:hypothetical protein LTR49_027838 [Elasticomyces elasticus]
MGYNAGYDVSPHARVCRDALDLALQLQLPAQSNVDVRGCQEAMSRTACYVAFSLDTISYTISTAGAEWSSSANPCSLDFCACHILHELGFDWASSQVPTTLRGKDWIWHVLRSKIILRHGLYNVPNGSLDLASLTTQLVRVRAELDCVVPALGLEDTQQDAKRAAAHIAEDTAEIQAAMLDLSSNIDAEYPGESIMDTLNSRTEPYLVAASGLFEAAYTETVQPVHDLMLAAEFFVTDL